MLMRGRGELTVGVHGVRLSVVCTLSCFLVDPFQERRGRVVPTIVNMGRAGLNMLRQLKSTWG